MTDDNGERDFELPGDIGILEEMLTQLDARLFVIDPLMAYLSSKIDSSRDQDIRRVMRRLKKVAEKCRCTIICLRHLNKGTATNPLYRGGGSIGIIGAARAGLMVAVHPEDDQRRVVASTKPNLAELAPSLVFRLASNLDYKCGYIDWVGSCDLKAKDLNKPSESEEKREASAERESKLVRAQNFLRLALRDGPVRVKDIRKEAARLNVAGSLERAVRSLGITLTYYDPLTGDECSWKLPL